MYRSYDNIAGTDFSNDISSLLMYIVLLIIT